MIQELNYEMITMMLADRRDEAARARLAHRVHAGRDRTTLLSWHGGRAHVLSQIMGRIGLLSA